MNWTGLLGGSEGWEPRAILVAMSGCTKLSANVGFSNVLMFPKYNI